MITEVVGSDSSGSQATIGRYSPRFYGLVYARLAVNTFALLLARYRWMP